MPTTTTRHADFQSALADHGLQLQRSKPQILQLNTGRLCNLTCVHCHVNAGPGRKEIITYETIDRVLDWLRPTDIDCIDLTGGTPEMVPNFRYLAESVRDMDKRVMVPCNLTPMSLQRVSIYVRKRVWIEMEAVKRLPSSNFLFLIPILRNLYLIR